MASPAVGAASRVELSLRHDSKQIGHDWLGTLAEVPLFDGLSKRDLRRIAKLASVRRFRPGSTMVRAGDAGTSFFVLLDGTARVFPAGGRGKRLGMGDSFGEMALLDGAPRSASVVAEGAVLTLTIGRASFRKLLREEPALSLVLLRTLAGRLRAAERSSGG